MSTDQWDTDQRAKQNQTFFKERKQQIAFKI
jgi:hypothetical protein